MIFHSPASPAPPFGPATGWQYGNGRILLRNLNRNYQPEAISDSDAGGLSLGYGFDAVGNLTQLQSATGDLVRAQYGYDGLNRLTQVMDGPTGTPIETYSYDATGNRTSLLNAGVTTAYSYPSDSHRLASVGGLSRAYDAAGNTTRMNGNARQFVYDSSGRCGRQYPCPNSARTSFQCPCCAPAGSRR